MGLNRNYYIDYLRGLCALMVVLYHFTTRYESLFEGHKFFITFSWGSYAVLAFFILSGYFAVRNIEKTTPKIYAIKRFMKLYPVYWVSIVLTMVLVRAFLPSRAVSIKAMLINFTMLQSLFGVEHVDGAYWTLFCELFFYGLVFFVCLVKKQHKTDILIIMWAVLQFFLLFLPNGPVFDVIKNVNSMLYSHCFMIGAIIARLEKNFDKTKNNEHKLTGINILLGCSLVFFVSIQFIQHDVWSGCFEVLAVLLIVAMVAIYRRGEGIKYKKLFAPLGFLGMISYPLYLLHQNIGYIIINFLLSCGINSDFLLLLVPIVIVVGLAFLVYKYVEKPISEKCALLCKKISNRMI